jgi:hypothetical protein
MATDITQKTGNKYVCDICSFCSYNKNDYTRHNLTQKHIRNTTSTFSNNLATDKTLKCEFCNKIYKDRTGLWRHKKNCNNLENKDTGEELSDKHIVMMLLKQNSEIIKENSELRKEQADIKELILEIVKNGTQNITNNTTTHTNSHNKAFNLNLFLNETCKNAMNITDFVDSIKLQLSDFINIGEIGFVEGISNIIVKKLNSLDETIRPIHCTDQKRETFYVKDENIWEKEDNEKKKIQKVIRNVSFKNENLMKTYKETYPDYNNPDSNRSDQYSKIMIEAMDCKEESREKIIRNISKATTIKSKF